MNTWIFVYSEYQEMWHAFKREEWVDYWNGNSKSLTKAKKLETLLYMIENKLI